MNRRDFIGALMAAPYVVRSGVLMPIRPLWTPADGLSDTEVWLEMSFPAARGPRTWYVDAAAHAYQSYVVRDGSSWGRAFTSLSDVPLAAGDTVCVANAWLDDHVPVFPTKTTVHLQNCTIDASKGPVRVG